MLLGDMILEAYDNEVELQLSPPASLVNLLTTLKDFNLEDLQETSFADLRIITEACMVLAARAQSLHNKRLKRTLE